MPILPGNLGHLPRLGFGLWQFKSVSVVLELLLVLLGAWYYWWAADLVTHEAGQGRTRAIVATVLILVSGFTVLILDAANIFG